MRQKGYRLTRWADDWVVISRTRAEAENALAQATKILDKLGVTLNREDLDCYITKGFEFRGSRSSGVRTGSSCPAGQDQIPVEPTASRHSDAEIVGPVQGSNQSPDQKAGASTTG